MLTRVSRRRQCANIRTAHTTRFLWRVIERAHGRERGGGRRGNRFSGVVFYLFIFFHFYFYFYDYTDDDDHRSVCARPRVRTRPRFIVQSFPRPRPRVHVYAAQPNYTVVTVPSNMAGESSRGRDLQLCLRTAISVARKKVWTHASHHNRVCLFCIKIVLPINHHMHQSVYVYTMYDSHTFILKRHQIHASV